ncbi:hypothetical protein CON35_08110 [Bacillus cereus]|nr:hypothetical protein [Bacillus cereus]PEF69126.1 hypothetical protein CON35_08110 [Bacillus cereus]
MSHLQIIGKQMVAGYEFTGIEGGFGEGKKAMLVKEIAEECKDDPTRTGIASLVIIILICVLTPLWPAFLTLKVVRLFSKRQEVK